MLNTKNQDILWGSVFDSLDDFDQDDEQIEKEENEKKRRAQNRKYQKWTSFLLFITVLSFVVLIVLYQYNKYIAINIKDNLSDNEEQFVKDFKQNKNLVVWLFSQSVQETQEIVSDINTQKQELLISSLTQLKDNKSQSYIDRHEILDKFVKNIVSTMKNNIDLIEKQKTNIWVYWFLPNEIETVILDSAIQRSFLSIETIKFFTALKIYSNIDSFITEFSGITSLSKDDILKEMTNIIDAWEINVQKYLIMCYLNPYEDITNCKELNNAINWTQAEISFFKDLMLFIKQKLENQDFPKLWIIFNSLDPKKNQIWFTININTFLDDEIYLSNKWIINPHIYIVSMLINWLRESHFILWDTIKFDSLKVNKRKVKEITVNTSTFTFNIPVQKATEKEIYDFVYEK